MLFKFEFYHMYICYLFIILLYLFEIVDEVLYYELFMYLSFWHALHPEALHARNDLWNK
jgi:hypothetical protein